MASSLTGDGELTASLSDPEKAAAFFAHTGVCLFENVLPTDLIDACRDDFKLTSARVREALDARGIGHEGSYFGCEVCFNEVCQRGRERLDIRTGMHDASLGDARLHGDGAPWMGFVRAVLGGSALRDRNPSPRCLGDMDMLVITRPISC